MGYHVRYTTSAKLLQDLTAALADQTLPARLNYWSRFEWLIIDEFGFDRLERTLGDPPLAMAFLDRVVDGAILLKIQGRSYRAHRAQRPAPPSGETPS